MSPEKKKADDATDAAPDTDAAPEAEDTQAADPLAAIREAAVQRAEPKATREAVRHAVAHGVSLEDVEGTGADGEITKGDVRDAVAGGLARANREEAALVEVDGRDRWECTKCGQWVPYQKPDRVTGEMAPNPMWRKQAKNIARHCPHREACEGRS